MNDTTLRHSAIVGGFPNHNGVQLPHVRFCDFLTIPLDAFSVSQGNCADRHPANAFLSFLKFAFRRQVDAFQIFVPRSMARLKSISGLLALAVGIANHHRAWSVFEFSLIRLFAHTYVTAKLSGVFSVIFDLERFATDGTLKFNHTNIISHFMDAEQLELQEERFAKHIAQPTFWSEPVTEPQQLAFAV